MKRRSLLFFGLHPNASAVALDDFLADGKADSRSWIFIADVQALEDDKNAVEILFGNANSIIADREMPAAWFLLRSNADFQRPVAPELDGVADQVLEKLS